MTVFTTGDGSGWRWTMMIRQPEAVSADLVQRLAGEVATTKSLPTALGLRLVDLEEGDAAQVLHVGPYADEAPTIACLHGFLREQRLSLRGRHHGDLPQRPASVSARQAPHHHPAAVRPWLSLRGPVHWPC